jgi:hypothetical protein
MAGKKTVLAYNLAILTLSKLPVILAKDSFAAVAFCKHYRWAQKNILLAILAYLLIVPTASHFQTRFLQFQLFPGPFKASELSYCGPVDTALEYCCCALSQCGNKSLELRLGRENCLRHLSGARCVLRFVAGPVFCRH